MSESVPALLLNIEYEPSTFGLIVSYTPISADGTRIDEWAGTNSIPTRDLPQPLAERLALFFDLTAQKLPARPIDFPQGKSVNAGRPPLTRFILRYDQPDHVQAYTGPPNHLRHAASVPRNAFSQDAQRLLRDILVSVEAECWKHLASSTGTQMAENNSLQVFISYRKREDVEQFAEAVAHRIEQEGIRARFDKWDMVAGDSLAGRIEEAFSTSRGCLIILSADFYSRKLGHYGNAYSDHEACERTLPRHPDPI